MLEVSLTALTFLTQIVMGLIVTNPLALSAPADIHEELYCLALNAYHEARGVSMDEMIAVSQVVMNRVDNSKHYTTVCDVITEGPIRQSWRSIMDDTLKDEERVWYPIRDKCQFSWYCDGKSDMPMEEDAWETALIVSEDILVNRPMVLKGAIHYHAIDVNPKWAKTKTFITRIGDHLFYK